MYDYKAMSVFVKVVEQGSMQAAAEKLAMTPSAITQSLQKLESQLSIKLLNRTTRKLSLTEAGEMFYQHASQMQHFAENAVKSVEQLRSQPVGELNIACVTGALGTDLVSALRPLLNNPELRLNLIFEDRVIDLLDERIDISLRAGKGIIQDNMIARHIYDLEWCIVANKSFLRKHGLPKDLQALAKLDWISFSNQRYAELTLHQKASQCTIAPNYRISCNTLQACRQLTLQGFGISMQPLIEIQQHIDAGELVPLFSDWSIPSVPLYLVTLQRIQSEKVRLAYEILVEHFNTLRSKNSKLSPS